MSERFKEPVLKTGESKDSVGSNPTPSAIKRSFQMSNSKEYIICSNCIGYGVVDSELPDYRNNTSQPSKCNMCQGSGRQVMTISSIPYIA